MSDRKRYYWIKLKYDFFTSKEIKKLRKIAGGDTYTIIYLKMQLKSLKNDCKLFFEGIENDFAEELALDIDEDVDNVRVTLAYLESRGLIELKTDNGIDEYHLIGAKENTGSETSSAIRVRKYRERKKLLQCNTDVTKRNIEKEKDIELDKEREIEKDLSIHVKLCFEYAKVHFTKIGIHPVVKEKHYLTAKKVLDTVNTEKEMGELFNKLVKIIPDYFTKPFWFNSENKECKIVKKSNLSIGVFLAHCLEILADSKPVNKEVKKKTCSVCGKEYDHSCKPGKCKNCIDKEVEQERGTFDIPNFNEFRRKLK